MAGLYMLSGPGHRCGLCTYCQVWNGLHCWSVCHCSRQCPPRILRGHTGLLQSLWPKPSAKRAEDGFRFPQSRVPFRAFSCLFLTFNSFSYLVNRGSGTSGFWQDTGQGPHFATYGKMGPQQTSDKAAGVVNNFVM